MFLNVINAINSFHYSTTLFLHGRLIVHETTFENDKLYTQRYLNNALKPVQDEIEHVMILLETDTTYRFYYSPRTGRFEVKGATNTKLDASGAVAGLFASLIKSNVDVTRVEGEAVEYYPEAKRAFNKSGKVPLLKFWEALGKYTTGYINEEEPRYAFFMKLLNQWYYARYTDEWEINPVDIPDDSLLEDVTPEAPDVTPLEPHHVFGEREFYLTANCLVANKGKRPGPEDMALMLGQLGNADVGVSIERKNAFGLESEHQMFRIEYGVIRDTVALNAQRDGLMYDSPIDAAIPALSSLINMSVWKNEPSNDKNPREIVLELFLTLGDGKALVVTYVFDGVTSPETGWTLTDIKRIHKPDGLSEETSSTDIPLETSFDAPVNSTLLGLTKVRWKYPEHLVEANTEFGDLIGKLCDTLNDVHDFNVDIHVIGVDTFIHLEKRPEWAIAVRFTESKVKIFHRDLFHGKVVEDSLIANTKPEFVAGYVVNKLHEIALD